MDRLTPPYKPGARLSTERQAWKQSERARSGFGTYLLMRRFPHRLLGIRRESYRSENLRSGYLFIKNTGDMHKAYMPFLFYAY